LLNCLLEADLGSIDILAAMDPHSSTAARAVKDEWLVSHGKKYCGASQGQRSVNNSGYLPLHCACVEIAASPWSWISFFEAYPAGTLHP
jgi:hypothetical protein